jgi:hypothetical protein
MLAALSSCNVELQMSSSKAKREMEKRRLTTNRFRRIKIDKKKP